MKKALYVLVVALSLIALVGCASTKGNVSTVSVTANAELKLQPDVARFSVSAETVEETTDQARAKTSQMVNQAVDILVTQFGIEKDDITTDYLNVSPSYVWKENERVLVGQRASQSIEVTLRNIDIYGDVFEALSKIDGISVSNATLDKLDKSEDLDQVRRLAINAALDKATAYAEASGMKIDNVLSISDGSSPSYSYPNVMMTKAAVYDSTESSTAYYAGDITISDSVTVVYQMTK